MEQYGSDTTISTQMRLVVFDCFDTLVCMRDRLYVCRQGVRALMNHLRRERRLLAVLSDGPVKQVRAALQQAGILAQFHAVYGREQACEEGPDGQLNKRLDRVLDEHAVAAAHAVYIGDSPRDGAAARRVQAHFIRVPGCADEAFDFARLITGASQYRSEDYDQTILARFRPESQQ